MKTEKLISGAISFKTEASDLPELFRRMKKKNNWWMVDELKKARARIKEADALIEALNQEPAEKSMVVGEMYLEYLRKYRRKLYKQKMLEVSCGSV